MGKFFIHIHYLTWVFIALMKHHDQNSSWIVCLHFHITNHKQRNSGQELKHIWNLEVGADTQAMRGADYWLAPYG